MANYIIARNELTEAIEHSYDVKKEKAESDFKFSIKAIDDENKKKSARGDKPKEPLTPPTADTPNY